MSKQLYEEAIADLKKVKEIAEDNAKRAVVEAVAPRIRELIERELLGEASFDDKKNILIDDETPMAALQNDPTNVNLTDLPDLPAGSEEIIPPVDPTYVVPNKIKKVIFTVESSNITEIKTKLCYVEKMIDSLILDKSCINESKSSSFKSDVSYLKNILGVIYEYVQRDVKNSTNRLGYNLKIRKCLEKLEKLQETKMKRNLLGEEKVTIELELPGIELGDALENASVDLILGGGEESDDEESDDEESDDEESDELDLDLTDEPGGDEESDGDDVLDLGGEDKDEDEEEEEENTDESYTMESKRLRNNMIVEIDEGMLRREISRMRMLREERTAIDSTSVEEVDTPAVVPTDPDPEDLDPEETETETDEACTYESVRMQMTNERKLQESLRKRATELRKLYTSYKTTSLRAKTLLERKEATTNSSKLKAAYAVTAQRYNRSVMQFNKLSESLSKVSVKRNVHSNNGVTPGASTGSDMLRKKLAETNLFNAKLLFTNKILQTESLTARQKAQVIEQLDSAETIREAKLIYESLSKTLVKPRRTVTEGRILGSSSQSTRSVSIQSQPLNEGIEAERWARLAGIK